MHSESRDEQLVVLSDPTLKKDPACSGTQKRHGIKSMSVYHGIIYQLCTYIYQTPLPPVMSASPSDSQRQGYTSLSSLLKSSPKSPDQDAHATRSTGWHFASVEEEGEGGQSRPRADRKEKKIKGKLGLWQMMALTISMGGSQIAWTV
jgi:hypothetical protein